MPRSSACSAAAGASRSSRTRARARRARTQRVSAVARRGRPVHDERDVGRAVSADGDASARRRALARRGHGFEKSCRPEDGALLHVLAARRGTAGRPRSGPAPASERRGSSRAAAADAVLHGRARSGLAARAAELFADDPNVTVSSGLAASLPRRRRSTSLRRRARREGRRRRRRRPARARRHGGARRLPVRSGAP